MADGPGPIHQYARKQKPRALPHLPTPIHTITPVPRAVVGSRTDVHLESHHHARSNSGRPPSSNELSLASLSRSGQTHPPSRPAISSNGASSTQTSKPTRKRFRKKVNGLFGDQTDLKKRMDKLLRKTDASQVVFSADAADADIVARHRDSANSLPATESIIEHLAATSPTPRPQHTKAVLSAPACDSFDFVELTETAAKMLGSPEKFANLRKMMGKLSPRSNERFLEELELGRPPQPAKKTEAPTPKDEITPPVLPGVDETGGQTQKDRDDECLSLSLVSLERTGAPAVLRRKARRLDRGYRCADVLRARLHGGANRDGLASPISKKSEPGRSNRSRLNILYRADLVKLKQNGKRSNENSLTDLVDGDDEGVLDKDRGRYRERKRRRIIRDGGGADVLSMKKADDMSHVEMFDSEENESEVRSEQQNPLKMLVEAATGPTSNYCSRIRDGEKDHREDNERKPRRKV